MFPLTIGKKSSTPWEGKESIYGFLKSHLNPDGTLPSDLDLPDETPKEKNQLRFSAGLEDRIFGRRNERGDSSGQVISLVVRQLVRLITKPTLTGRIKLYKTIMNDRVLPVVDEILEVVAKTPKIKLPRLDSEAVWMATEGAHREVVKFGVALLGLFRSDEHVDVLMTLGKHDEFTLFAVVAIQNSMTSANEIIWKLAKQVHGWGKIYAVERLEPSTPEIKQWIVEHGCMNAIMPQYLAYTCAIRGDLDTVLSGEIFKGIYTGAGAIISALIEGGPAEDIDDYEDSPSVIKRYLEHSRSYAQDLADLMVILDVKNFLTDDEQRWENRLTQRWTQETREYCEAICDSIMQHPLWIELIVRDIDSDVYSEYFNAVNSARALEIDVWPILYNKLQSDSLNSSLYFNLMRSTDKNRIRCVVSFAESHLPLSLIATGPADDMGLGPGYEPHSCLDFVIQDLDKFEGIGTNLVSTALQSPVIRNRNISLNVLEAWGLQSWPPGIIDVLMKQQQTDPVGDVRKRIGNLLEKVAPDSLRN